MPDPSPESDILDDRRITAIGLLVEAETALVRVLDDELRQGVGMPLSTYETLIRLGRSPGRRLRQIELSRQLSLTTGGVTRLIDRLEAAGLVRRTSSPDDVGPPTLRSPAPGSTLSAAPPRCTSTAFSATSSTPSAPTASRP
jgi:hypothetical protein